MACLNEHTQKIKQENRSLRHELLLLIRKTRALHEHRNHLEDQQRQLVMEQQYARDLKTLRSARQHKVRAQCTCIGGSRARVLGTRAPLAESRSKFFHFHAVFRKNCQIIGWRTPPPLGNPRSATDMIYFLSNTSKFPSCCIAMSSLTYGDQFTFCSNPCDNQDYS